MLTALLFWIIVGLVAGFLASIVMRGGGYGIIGDIVVGIVGALIGGFIMNAFGLGAGGIIYSIIVAFIGACILIAILHAFSRGTRRTYDYTPTNLKSKNNIAPSALTTTQSSLPQENSYVPPLVQQPRPSYTSQQILEQSVPLPQPEYSSPPVKQYKPIQQSPPVEPLHPRYAPPTLSLFVSHSSRDDEFGLKLVHDLRRELGGDEAVWYDSEGGLYGGDAWWSRIVSVLEKCDVFIIIISPNSMSSKWVMKELDIATVEGKRIIPILYQQANVRTDLRAIQHISFLDTVPYNVALDRLVQALKR